MLLPATIQKGFGVFQGSDWLVAAFVVLIRSCLAGNAVGDKQMEGEGKSVSGARGSLSTVASKGTKARPEREHSLSCFVRHGGGRTSSKRGKTTYVA